jgi:hypothetical protein
MPQVDLFGDSNVPQGTEIYDKRIGKIQAEIHNYLRQGLVPGAVQQILTKLDNISIDADTVNLNTDQLEAKLDTLNGLTTTIQTDLSSLNGHLNPHGTLAFSSLTLTALQTTELLNNKNNRKYLLIQNNTTGDLRVNFGSNATASAGIILQASVGLVFESRFVPTQSVSAFASVAGSVAILEG